MNSKTSLKKKIEEYGRHRTFLEKVKNTSLFCPRYDMLSLNNNLLLHRNFDPKKQLLPKQENKQIVKIDQMIRMRQKEQYMHQQSKWYQKVLNQDEVQQKKFSFQYAQSTPNSLNVREQLNKIYNLKRPQRIFSKSIYEHSSR